MRGSTGSTTRAGSNRTYPGAGCLKLASCRRAPKMSRNASRLISSQTSNWISTRTEPCSDLFWAMAADGADVGARAGTATVEFAVSIESAFCFSALLKLVRCDPQCDGDRKPLRRGQVSMWSIVPERGWDWQWAYKSIFINELREHYSPSSCGDCRLARPVEPAHHRLLRCGTYRLLASAHKSAAPVAMPATAKAVRFMDFSIAA